MRAIHIAQYTAFAGAQINNSLLIYLIITRSDKQLGDFRYIMGCFALYAIFYSWVEIFTQPLTFIEGPALGVIVDSGLRNYKMLGHYVVCLFCACFGLCITLLSTQFYFRYLAMCRPNKLESVSGSRLYLIFIPSLLVFVGWYINVLIGMADTYEKQNFLREPFLNNFSIDSYQIAFVVCMLWTIDQDGGKNWNLVDCVAALINVFIIGFCFIFILVCAKKIYKNSKEFKMFVSSKTKELNRQLFLCLILQTLIPFILMYCPVGLLYIFPFFEIEVRWLVSIPALSCCIYPSIEPLIAIFCIKGFRSFLFGQKPSSQVHSTINTVTALTRSIAPRYTGNNKVFIMVMGT
ncbi:Protein CBG25138 [Caenorhabditis briggsae]|uniref:Serpentine receptor class r-10 n=1 Tax=Caenorhabditis briggsae TaxID=6238 RepID=A8XD65_CAEBR|nr:Protein CBG25138 [Caenorhabditis briggsae]CAP30584.1 Protein CBG25138 [Caenorhabditis briggsae]